MPNNAVNDNARDTFLREALAIMVRNHGPEDIVRVLSQVMDDYAYNYARRTGDTDGASAMRLISAHLDGLEDFISNFDPTTH